MHISMVYLWVSEDNFFLFFKMYLFHVCVSTVAVFRHTERGSHIPLQMVVSHQVVAGNGTQDLWKSSQSLDC